MFSRPICWLAPTWGRAVVPLEYAGLRSDRVVRGPRQLGSPELVVKSASSHLEVLRQSQVEPEPARHLPHRALLRVPAHARDRDAHVDRGADAGEEEAGLEVDLPVGDRDHVRRDVRRDVPRLGLDDRKCRQRAAARIVGQLAGALEKPRVTIGRGKDSEVVVDDASISHQHAALELGSGGYRIRDLGSTNGVVVNGARMALAELKHGDRIALGQIELRYVVEARKSAPKTHSIE